MRRCLGPKAGVDIGVTPFKELKKADSGKYLQHWESGEQISTKLFARQ